MKQTQQLKLTQSLKLTPHMKQGLDLLQLNNIDLQQIIDPILRQNPFLIKKDAPVESVTTLQNEETETTWEDFSISLWSPDQEDRFNFSDPFQDTLKQGLQWELNSCFFSEEDRLIAAFIIDALDDQGYLTESFNNLEHLLKPYLPLISKPTIEEVRQKILAIDPYGLASQNLQEFLLCQLPHIACGESIRKLAAILINDYIDFIAKHDRVSLIKNTSYSSKELNDALELIYQLRPRPWIKTSEPLFISPPDLLLEKHHDKWRVSINDNTLSRVYFDKGYYEKMAAACQNQAFFINAYNEARNLLLNMQRRTQTLLKTAQTIVAYQSAYLSGIDELRPLDLSLLSKQTKLHTSTLSRTIKNKLIATPRGVIALKELLSGTSTNDNELSTHTIQALIKQLISEEPPHAPLSDQSIMEILKSCYQIQIARRTVAKYRSSLGILSASLRKKFPVE
ncbi:MAG: RNA polymerase factor sigma-54 [Legionellales bacterium]|nr:RNA polymerase factor sigma-54 [Legionellales bacterium]